MNPLSKKDIEVLVDALENPLTPNETLKEAAREYINKLSGSTNPICEYSGLPSVESYKEENK